jgi:FkbM family methyltransferase
MKLASHSKPEMFVENPHESNLVVNKAASLVYNMFAKFYALENHKNLSKFWQRAWNKSCSKFSGPIETTIHGYKVILNYGYAYPIFSRRFPSYNNPLVELVYQAHLVRKSPIKLIDIGAAIGDTILLVYSNCPDMIGGFCCIDGDKEFFDYLKHNLGGFKEGKLILSMLSDNETVEKQLVRTHRGTASAQGTLEVPACSLDSMIGKLDWQDIDVLKIDVDGFDGKILLGSMQTLQKYRPAVIFEWHPILCKQTNNGWVQHFEALDACGYTKFIWFTKYGDFSHIMTGFDINSVNELAEICFRNRHEYDWHYDIVALHQDSLIDPISLAEQSFAKVRKSRF